MSSSKSANAVLAKTRAKYGKRLTEKDYASLLSCKSVAEVVTYLKNNTSYKEVLKKVNEREVHRGRLELILKQKLAEDFSSLCIYAKGTSEHFSEFILRQSEIEQIIHFLTTLTSKHKTDAFFTFPQYFLGITAIDFTRMAQAHTYEELFDVLALTPYGKILAPLRPAKGAALNIAKIENVLYRYSYRILYEDIAKYSAGNEQKALIEMFDSIMNYMNFVRIYRLKRYYHAPYETTKEYAFPYGSIPPKVMEKMLRAQTGDEVFASVKGTSFGRELAKLTYVYAGQIDNLGLYRVTKKNIHFSTYPLVVMMSYYFVMKTEYDNIVSIIEGVRYNVDSDKIKQIVIN